MSIYRAASAAAIHSPNRRHHLSPPPSYRSLPPRQLEMTLMVRADIPESNYGANVQVKIPMPRGAVAVTTELVSVAAAAAAGAAGGGAGGGAKGLGGGAAGGGAVATGQVRMWDRRNGADAFFFHPCCPTESTVFCFGFVFAEVRVQRDGEARGMEYQEVPRHHGADAADQGANSEVD